MLYTLIRYVKISCIKLFIEKKKKISIEIIDNTTIILFEKYLQTGYFSKRNS